MGGAILHPLPESRHWTVAPWDTTSARRCGGLFSPSAVRPHCGCIWQSHNWVWCFSNPSCMLDSARMAGGCGRGSVVVDTDCSGVLRDVLVGSVCTCGRAGCAVAADAADRRTWHGGGCWPLWGALGWALAIKGTGVALLAAPVIALAATGRGTRLRPLRAAGILFGLGEPPLPRHIYGSIAVHWIRSGPGPG